MSRFWDRWGKYHRGNRSSGASDFRPTVEALEERLLLSWSGTPPTSIRLPSSFVSVTLNELGDAAGTATIDTKEVDFYRFTAPVSGGYRFYATTPSSNLDTVLGVFNSRGRRIAYNDDVSQTNTDSELRVSLLAGQRYYFGITNYKGTPGGAYTWYVNGPATGPVTDDAYEENDSTADVDPVLAPANLGELTSLTTITGLKMTSLDPGREDWFKITMDGEGGFSDFISISFFHVEGDLDLYLHDSGGTEILSSEGLSNTEYISLLGLGSGDYYIRVFGFDGAVSSNYTLRIDPIGAGGPVVPTGDFDISLSLDGFTTSQMTIFQQAAHRWEQIIIGDVPDTTYNGKPVDDILIEAIAVPIDGVDGILAQAGPDDFRSSFLPIHGGMEFDSADITALETAGELFSTIFHEMGHVLGFGTIWEDLGLLTGAGTSSSNPRFTGDQATAEYQDIFDTTETSVPVENGGGEGTEDSHWRESVFDDEIMTGFLDPGEAISRITIASMADLGYTVNLDAADSYVKPSVSSLQSTPSGGGSKTSSRMAAPKGPEWRDLIFALTDHRKTKGHSGAADAFFAGLGGD